MKTLNELAKEHREFSVYEPSETVYSDRTIIDKESFGKFKAHIESNRIVENENLDNLINKFVGYGDKCPMCGGELDTGFNCMVCGRHFDVKQKGSVTCEN